MSNELTFMSLSVSREHFAVIKDPAMRKLAVYQLKCIARI